jgi:glycosyltransferase involved in cell wall biosynthesis
MIKVLQVFNKLNQGGIEHVVINLMKNMDSSKVEFHFAMMSGEKGVLDDYVTQLGGKIHYFSEGTKSLKNVKKNLDRIMKDYGPFDVVHSHVYFFSGYILKIAYQNKIPIRIAHAHDTYKGEKRSFIRKIYESRMKHLINTYATYKLGVSKEAASHVFGKYDNNTYIVNNGVNIDKYKFSGKTRDDKRTELGIQPNEKVIINIGRFEEQKDHEYLIKLFQKLLMRDKEFKLLLIGSGSLKSHIINMAKELGILDKIIFLENRNDINELLEAADIFVMPSKYEGLPIVLIEAQASGIPCVVSTNITKEALICPNVYALTKENMDIWVKKIMVLRDARRMDNSQRLSEAGFNIKNIALFVQKMYLTNIEDN